MHRWTQALTLTPASETPVPATPVATVNVYALLWLPMQKLAMKLMCVSNGERQSFALFSVTITMLLGTVSGITSPVEQPA